MDNQHLGESRTKARRSLGRVYDRTAYSHRLSVQRVLLSIAVPRCL